MRHINITLRNLASAALALTLAGTALAQDLRAPLDPSDPRAFMDPVTIASYKPMEAPEYAPIGTQSAMVRLQSVDLDSGEMRQSAFVSSNRALKAPFNGRPFKGIATTNSAEPKSYDFNAQYVIGADNRTKITNTQQYPWSTHCKLFVTYPNGDRRVGSGTLVQSRYVVTAGHCIYNASRGGWATRVEVVPGLNGSYRPFGAAFASRLASNSGWTSDSNRDHDHAVIKLDRTIGNSTGWLGYGAFSNTTLNNAGGHLSAYDADRDSGLSQLYRYGAFDSLSSKQMEYKWDTSGGSSGGGVYILQNGGRYVMGVNAWEKTWWFFGTHYINGGTRLDSTKVGWMNNWLNGGL